MCLFSFWFLSLNHSISSICNHFKPTFGLMKARNHFLLVKDTRQLLVLSHKLTRQSLTLLRKPVTDALKLQMLLHGFVTTFVLMIWTWGNQSLFKQAFSFDFRQWMFSGRKNMSHPEMIIALLSNCILIMMVDYVVKKEWIWLFSLDFFFPV